MFITRCSQKNVETGLSENIKYKKDRVASFPCYSVFFLCYFALSSDLLTRSPKHVLMLLCLILQATHQLINSQSLHEQFLATTDNETLMVLANHFAREIVGGVGIALQCQAVDTCGTNHLRNEG